jgi:hypothetical protein
MKDTKMRNIFVKVLPLIALIFLSGCSTKVFVKKDELAPKVGLSKEYKNSFTKDVFDIFTSEDIEDVSVYLPKDSMTVRIFMRVANIEDVIYMKLVDDSAFEVDKVLRRVEDISKLGLKQDGYVYEPSVLKNVVTLQLYIPSIYLYENLYKPKLIFSFKRNSRSVQEKVNLYFMKHKLSVIQDKESGYEKPFYSNIKEYCKKGNKLDGDFISQIDKVNTNRIDTEFLEEIKILCN